MYIRYFIIAGFLLIGLAACKDDSSQTTTTLGDAENEELIELRNKVELLEFESSRKDSVLNEAFSFFNDVQANLLKISVKEDEIRIKSSDPELTQEDQEWILQEINNINFLRKENAKNIETLRNHLKERDIQISELKGMVDRLVRQIHDKDEQIAVLQNSLSDLDMEYAALFDEYQEQVELALDVMKEMNTVYFAYGTLDELIENEVLMKEGGFIGIGRKTNIAEDFNQQYFQQMDKTKVKELKVIGKKPKLATDHPVSSYEWKGDELVILDADKFWRISNYLVIVVR